MLTRLVALALCLLATAATAQPLPAKLDSVLTAYVAIHRFNGSALVIQDGKKVYERSIGYQNAATNQRLTSKSIMPIGSLTKSFTALLILKLAEAHRLALADPVSTYLPDYPNGQRITLHHLLTNSGGVYEKFRNPAFVAQLEAAQAFTEAERMAFFQQQPLDFEPGTKFSYSNSGFDVLGSIIEKVTGASYAKAVRAYIFKPLRMRQSGFGFADLRDKHKAILYAYVSATKHVETKPWNASLTFSSGGLYSSLNDLRKFYQGLRTYRLVSRETFAQATTPFLGGYGYGWYVDSLQGERVIDHGGNVAGATSYLLLMPERKTGIILLNNITSTSLERIGNTLYVATQHKPYRLPTPKKAVALDERTLARYVGTYAVSATYQVAVWQEGAKLFVRLNKGSKIPLSAEKEGFFFADDEDIVLEFVTKDAHAVEVRIKQGLTTKVADKLG
jgi:CubicO group peptidase (beta-lactamase class C family)